MRFLFVALFCLMTSQVISQINADDSTAQVVGFWDKAEKQSYLVSYEKMKVSGTDTTSREMTKYEVDVTIKDSTANSYTIEWLYKNFSVNSENKLLQKIAKSGENMKVLIKTDEFGAIQEVVNWTEVRDHMKKTFSTIKNEFKNIPKLEEIFGQLEGAYLTKDAIEASAIKDAQQFYSFHGAKYKLGEELKVKMKAPNVLGGEPFDSDITVSLDEINEDDNNFVLRIYQTVDQQQLTEATYNYLVNLSKKAGVPAPKKEDLAKLKDLKNETFTASRIHGSGWPIYTVQTIVISTGDVTNIQERIIELKD
jgi:hypothetical protein